MDHRPRESGVKPGKNLEQRFESALWSTRLIVLLAVFASLAAAVGLFVVSTVDAVALIREVVHYATAESGALEEVRTGIITHAVEMVDGFLLATILLIFGLGLYELFISRIDEAQADELASKVLVIHSLDDLKMRLAKVILMILIVRFFEYALKMSFNTPRDLLFLATGVAFLGLALWLSHLGEKPH